MMSPAELRHSNGTDFSRNAIGGVICPGGTSPERLENAQSFQYVLNVARISALDVVVYKTEQ